jgi:hypothetical protein
MVKTHKELLRNLLNGFLDKMPEDQIIAAAEGLASGEIVMTNVDRAGATLKIILELELPESPKLVTSGKKSRKR